MLRRKTKIVEAAVERAHGMGPLELLAEVGGLEIAALAHLDLEPLLDLGLRLGEGTGAVLAVPLVQAAARVLSEMATLDELLG